MPELCATVCRLSASTAGVVLAVSCVNTALACAAQPAQGPPEVADLLQTDRPHNEAPATDEASIDAQATFERLVERYRALTQYSDDVVVEHVTARNGEPAVREETRVACEIDPAGHLAVTTASTQLSDVFGLGCFDPAALEDDEALQPADEQPRESIAAPESELDFWLVPHMALRFADSPLDSFRSGVQEGFTPVRAERVTVEEADLLRLDLQSGDGQSEDYRAKFELYIDPSTWLVKRIRGVQLMPDGANLLTEFTITPKRVVSREQKNTKTGSAI